MKKTQPTDDFKNLLASLGIESLPWYERYYNTARYEIEDFLYECKMKYQTLTRGYSDRNVWNMYYDVAIFNIKLLKHLRKHKVGYPSGLTQAKWNKILDTMIDGFEAVVEMECTGKDLKKRFEKGMALYTQYYRHLWD